MKPEDLVPGEPGPSAKDRGHWTREQLAPRATKVCPVEYKGKVVGEAYVDDTGRLHIMVTDDAAREEIRDRQLELSMDVGPGSPGSFYNRKVPTAHLRLFGTEEQ